MGKRKIPVSRFAAATALMAVLCAVVVTPLAAQQAADAPVTSLAVPEAAEAPAVTETTPAKAGSESNVLPGPRLLPTHFQSFEPVEPRVEALEPSPAAAGQHTIVVSTLVLVLAIVILVLLID